MWQPSGWLLHNVWGEEEGQGAGVRPAWDGGGQDVMPWLWALTQGLGRWLHISSQHAGKDSQHIIQTPQALAILSYTSVLEHDRDPVLHKYVLTVLVLAARTTRFLPQSTSADARNLCYP